MDPVLAEMLSELSPPLLLVGNDRRLHFASPAFRRLTGIEITDQPCHALLLPPLAQTEGRCCWNVLDLYQKSEEPGLWRLRTANGRLLPVRCEIRAITVGQRPVMLAVLLSPLTTGSSPFALSFFRCLHRSARSTEDYEANVATYLKRHCGLGLVMWLSSADGTLGRVHRRLWERMQDEAHATDATLSACEVRDVILEVDGQPRIFHVFRARRDTEEIGLAVNETRGRLDAETLAALCAAVTVRLESRDGPASVEQVPDPSLIEVLSPTERQILFYLRQGLSDKEIANLRRVSVNTARNQVRNVMRKLGVHKRVQLAGRMPAPLGSD